MEGQEEVVKSKDQTDIVKGKRSKRQRPSALCCSLASSSSSGCGVVGTGNSDDGGSEGGEYGSLSSATNSGDAYESNGEEEEMANCLILLAQGRGPRQPVEKNGQMERFDTQKFPEIATAVTSKAGLYFYECKTCNRTFPSFQALGGHRASHKKPKAIVEQRKDTTTVSTEYLEEARFSLNSTPSRPLQVAGKGFHSSKAKIHECSICGLEFTSGQALGGHMRRHRASTSTQVVMSIDANATMESQHVGIKPRDILCLDLNLPAPEDDSKFHLTSTQQSLVFSASALVDCHY